MAQTLKQSLTLTQGTGITISNTGVSFDASATIDQNISVGNDISITGNVQFNQITASYDLDGYTLLPDRWTTDFTAGGDLTVTGDLTIPGNASVGANVTAQRIESELTSSTIIFQSGSTQFGDTPDDTHHMTGSVNLSGSFILNGYSVDEISNDITLANSSATALLTESASKAYADNNISSAGSVTDEDLYIRKNFNKTAISISNNTASFSAVTASAPNGTISTSETDFLFFNNGQAMEHDALTIQQSGSIFYLKVDSDSVGYVLSNTDEIKAWGKFNA